MSDTIDFASLLNEDGTINYLLWCAAWNAETDKMIAVHQRQLDEAMATYDGDLVGWYERWLELHRRNYF